jgi:ELWxxDGT repeat protein
VLLKDINPGTDGSKPEGFATLGDKVIFSATENQHGTELWITDGTSEGTVLLADLLPGSSGSEPKHFRTASSLVFFSAYDSQRGWTLWKTNGTATGTEMVVDIIPGSNKNNFTTNLGAVGGKFYFAANDEVHGQELWVTDGTEAGTHIIDVVPGSAGSYPGFVSDVHGVAYFKADVALWRTNGLPEGTFKVSELEPFTLTEMNNWVYFTAFHPDYGVELFKVEFTKLDQQVVVETIQAKTFGDAPFQIIASASSGLPLCITSEEELMIKDKTATIVKPGMAAVTVRQEGDALFNAAECTQTFCISPAKPIITVSNLDIGKPILTSSANEGNQWFKENEEIAGADDKTWAVEESGTFSVKAVVDGCSSVFSDDAMVLITGIERKESVLTFHPNPAQHQLTIQAAAEGGEIQIDILDIQGKRMDKFQIQPNESVDHSLHGYPSGIYLMRIATSTRTSYSKFIKQ